MFLKYLLDIFLWVLLVIINITPLKSSPLKFNVSYWPSIILIMLFAVFGYITGDYFNYISIYDASFHYNDVFHVEPFYAFLMEISHGSYNLWRFFIWIPAVLVYGWIIKRLKLDVNVAFLFFAILPMFYFCSHRQYLGMAIMYSGLVLFCTSTKHAYMGKLLALLIFISSVFFHRSMPLYMLLTVIALLPFKKVSYVLMVVLFPLIYNYLDPILEFITSVGGSSTIDLFSKNYIESDFRVDITIWGIVGNLVNQLPTYLLLIYAIYQSTFKKGNYVPSLAKVFLNIAVLQVYLSLLFTGQDVSAFLAPRFREYSLLPLSLFYGIYFSSRPINRYVRILIFMMLFADLYMLAYSVYKL